MILFETFSLLSCLLLFVVIAIITVQHPLCYHTVLLLQTMSSGVVRGELGAGRWPTVARSTLTVFFLFGELDHALILHSEPVVSRSHSFFFFFHHHHPSGSGQRSFPLTVCLIETEEDSIYFPNQPNQAAWHRDILSLSSLLSRLVFVIPFTY